MRGRDNGEGGIMERAGKWRGRENGEGGRTERALRE